MKKIMILFIIIFIIYKIYTNLQEKSKANNQNYNTTSANNTRHNKNKFNRDDWGRWADYDRDGFNTREELLKQKSRRRPAILNNKVIDGAWYDEYTGKYLYGTNDVTIDHIVPLRNAHYSGGSNWSKEKKNRFFNDKDNLIIVSKKVNEDKGHKSPVEWLPPNREYQAEYIRTYYKVKKKYGLKIEYGVSNWVYNYGY